MAVDNHQCFETDAGSYWYPVEQDEEMCDLAPLKIAQTHVVVRLNRQAGVHVISLEVVKKKKT